MTDIQFVSDMTVELIDFMGGDDRVVQAARVSTVGAATRDDESAGLINFLVRDRHGSPLEHSTFQWRVTAPLFVWREHHRHRIASYNEESGRYKELDPVFYVPAHERPLVQVGKAGAYTFEPGSVEQSVMVRREMDDASWNAYVAYKNMLHAGVAREVARMILPLNIMSTCVVTMNARALMNFLSLRRNVEGQAFPSFPQREIEMVAERYESDFERLMPLTHAAFVRHGRVSP